MKAEGRDEARSRRLEPLGAFSSAPIPPVSSHPLRARLDFPRCCNVRKCNEECAKMERGMWNVEFVKLRKWKRF